MPFFRTLNTRANVSIESATEGVPDDGYFYVLTDGSIVARFRRLKQAQQLYSKLVADKNLPPATVTQTSSSKESIIDDAFTYMSNKALLGIETKRKGGRFQGRR